MVGQLVTVFRHPHVLCSGAMGCDRCKNLVALKLFNLFIQML